jgi:hypothetical protein
MEHAYEISVPIIAEPELGIDWAHVKQMDTAKPTVTGIRMLLRSKGARKEGAA